MVASRRVSESRPSRDARWQELGAHDKCTPRHGST